MIFCEPSVKYRQKHFRTLCYFYTVIAFFLINFSIVADTDLSFKILNEIDHQKIYESKQWKRLLHYKNGESEIDDPTFFLSKEGKTNLKSELKASVLKLINDKTDDKKSTLCYYPSRSNWILKNFPQLKSIIKYPKCLLLKKELADLDVKRVTMVLASAHINSPASAFGHTFLRLDSSEDTVLASFSVNYAAITGETNGFVYAYQGLLGGYQGRYSVEPYSKRVETYSDLEQRDIWEYPLNFTPEEIDRLKLHILEIRNFYADYYFLSENCSYNILWLLEVARNDVELTKQFDFKAIPIDTLRAVSDAGLISDIVYRPSKRKKILIRSKEIEGIPNAIEFAKSHNYDLEKLNGLSKKHKAKALELATHLLQLNYSNKKVSKKHYFKHFIRLLSERSQLGQVLESEIKQPAFPKAGHKSNRLNISFDNQDNASINFKIAYHDIYDNEQGFIPGSYINFFDTSIKVSKKGKFKLDHINLLDIRSYALQDTIFKPISWQVTLGAKRIFNDELDPFFKVGTGVALGSDSLFSYASLAPSFYSRTDNNLSVSANIGVIYNPSSSLKLGFQGTQEWFKNNEAMTEIEPFVTYKISDNTALNLRYNYKIFNNKKNNNDFATLSLFWYF